MQHAAKNQGSRFGVLDVEEEDSGSLFNLEDLRSRLNQVPELGAGVAFSSVSREAGSPSRAQSKRGGLYEERSESQTSSSLGS